MSEGTFTAGPWRINRAIGGHYRDGKLLSWHITADPSGSVDPICERTFGTDRSDAEDSANARLIAAAPELYEALKAAVEIIDKWIEPEAMGIVRSGDGVLGHCLRDEYLVNFRAALLKATPERHP